MTTSTAQPAAAETRRRASILDPHSPTFSTFADVLYVGVLVFALSIPLVTSFAALSAGTQALREAKEADRHVTIGSVWRPFADRVVRHWFVALVLPAVVTALLIVDLVVMPYLVPDAVIALVLPAVVASAAGAIALRIAGTWRTGVSARDTLAESWRRMAEDAGGSLLLALTVAAAGAVVAVIPLLALVMPGLLALAAVALDHRFERSLLEEEAS
jgi:hypothetical protein